MLNVPADAEYHYNYIYYKKGTYYALYFSDNMWKESASVTNAELETEGVPLNVN